MSKTSSSSSGIGFFGLLFIVFLVLKLTNIIGWSWWWVTAPLWAPLLMLVVGIVVFGWFFLTEKKKRNVR